MARLKDPRGKGRRFENSVAEMLQEALPVGWRVRRVPLSGSAPGYKGDVEIQIPAWNKSFYAECKDREDLRPVINRLKQLLKAHGHTSDLLFFKANREETWVAMPQTKFEELLVHIRGWFADPFR